MPDDIDRLIAADPDQILRASKTQPRRLAKAYQAMANIKREQDRRRYEESFEWFIMRAWQEVDPSPLDLNWHHQVIADHLVGVMNEEIRNLIINIPPRTGKTLVANVLYPAWVWCQPPENWGYLCGPHVQFLCVCYGATLSEEIAVKMRRLVSGDWYQSLWGDRVSILPDQQARANFGNTAGGARISSSIEGGLLGRGGDCVSGQTIVETDSGPMRVDSLDGCLTLRYILSYDFSVKAPAYRRLIAVARRQAKQLWRVHTRYGNVVEATGDHKVFTRRGWVRAMALVAGDVLLRCVREGEQTPRERNGQMGEKRQGRAVLQPFVRDDSEESRRGKVALVLPDMRQEAAVEGEASQLSVRSRMPEGRSREKRVEDTESPAEAMRNVRDNVQAAHHQDPGAILFEEMPGRWSLEADEREGEPRISAWSQSGSAPLVRRKAEGMGAGRQPVRDLQHEIAPGRASHQHESERQQAREPGLPMSSASQGDPLRGAFKAEEDTVSLVERVYPAQDEVVFDLQIEETRCFFADGILVHNCMIIDDPLTPKEANSQIERERVMRDIREGLATRLNNAAKAARILVMQRLHMNDPTSYALESWKPNVHLMFPMRYETRWPCDSDIRGQLTPKQLGDMGLDSAEGLLLWPTRFTENTVASLEVELGTFGAASQLQQYPVPRSGGIVGEDDWMIWPEDPATVDDLREFPGGAVALPLPEVTHVVLLLDTAMSEKETADYNACVVMGVWYRKRKAVTYQRPTRMDNILLDPGDYTDDGEQPRVIMMGAWRMRAKLNDETKDAAGNRKGVVQRVIDTARRFHVDRIIIENKTRGLDVRNEIQRQLGEEQMSLQLFNPKAHGDKLARLASVQPLFEQKLIYAPANVRLIRDRETGESRVAVNEFAWVRAVVDEVSQVPRGAHDDYSDCVSMGLITLRTEGYLELTKEYLAGQIRARMFRGQKNTIRESYGV